MQQHNAEINRAQHLLHCRKGIGHQSDLAHNFRPHVPGEGRKVHQQRRQHRQQPQPDCRLRVGDYRVQPAHRVRPTARRPGRIPLRVPRSRVQQVQPRLNLLLLRRRAHAALDPHPQQLIAQRRLRNDNPILSHRLVVAHQRRGERVHHCRITGVVEARHVRRQLRQAHAQLGRPFARKTQRHKRVLHPAGHLLQLILRPTHRARKLLQLVRDPTAELPKHHIELAQHLLRRRPGSHRLLAHLHQFTPNRRRPQRQPQPGRQLANRSQRTRYLLLHLVELPGRLARCALHLVLQLLQATHRARVFPANRHTQTSSLNHRITSRHPILTRKPAPPHPPRRSRPLQAQIHLDSAQADQQRLPQRHQQGPHLRRYAFCSCNSRVARFSAFSLIDAHTSHQPLSTFAATPGSNNSHGATCRNLADLITGYQSGQIHGSPHQSSPWPLVARKFANSRVAASRAVTSVAVPEPDHSTSFLPGSCRS